MASDAREVAAIERFPDTEPLVLAKAFREVFVIGALWESERTPENAETITQDDVERFNAVRESFGEDNQRTRIALEAVMGKNAGQVTDAEVTDANEALVAEAARRFPYQHCDSIQQRDGQMFRDGARWQSECDADRVAGAARLEAALKDARDGDMTAHYARKIARIAEVFYGWKLGQDAAEGMKAIGGILTEAGE